MNSQLRTKAVSPTARRGFSLLELLVAMTLTLLLTALVVQVFSFVSDGVFNSRATMDLSDQLRNAKHRIIQDLRGITAPTTPPLDPCSEIGYFEYVEGAKVSNFPGGDVGRPHPTLTTSMQTYFGDLDDILMFTTVSYDEEFVGKAKSSAATERYAEIAYYLRPISGRFGSADYFTLHRRIWLINANVTMGTSYGVADQSLRQEGGVYEKHAPNTVVETGDVSNTNVTSPGRAVPNSLGDLTMRDRRPIHQPNTWPYEIFHAPDNGSVSTTIRSITSTSWPAGNLYLTVPSLNQQSATKFPGPISDTSSSIYPPYNQYFRVTGTSTEPPNHPTYEFQPAAGNREHADILLTNVVGFDVKAWDPGAPVFRATPGTAEGSNPDIVGLIVPGDAGYGGDGSKFNSSARLNPVGALQRFINNPSDPDAKPVSFGAYADLNYMWINRMGGTYNSQRRAAYLASLAKYERSVLGCGAGTLPRPSFAFATPRNRLSGYSPPGYEYPAVYDTWSRHYEYDGIDNDGDNLIDEGTNGLDDNNNGFIDEPDLDLDGDGIPENNGETDAPPPYAAPLRGIKITIRVMEQDSRQVREVTIIHEFLPL